MPPVDIHFTLAEEPPTWQHLATHLLALYPTRLKGVDALDMHAFKMGVADLEQASADGSVLREVEQELRGTPMLLPETIPPGAAVLVFIKLSTWSASTLSFQPYTLRLEASMHFGYSGTWHVTWVVMDDLGPRIIVLGDADTPTSPAQVRLHA